MTRVSEEETSETINQRDCIEDDTSVRRNVERISPRRGPENDGGAIKSTWACMWVISFASVAGTHEHSISYRNLPKTLIRKMIDFRVGLAVGMYYGRQMTLSSHPSFLIYALSLSVLVSLTSVGLSFLSSGSVGSQQHG